MISSMVFYSPSWDGATKVVVEYKGKMFDVREGYGRPEGWTNTHSAIDVTYEVDQFPPMSELSEDEIGLLSEEDLQGIEEAVLKAV